MTAEVNQATQVATINDTVSVTGSLGCPANGSGTWNAEYLITDDEKRISTYGQPDL